MRCWFSGRIPAFQAGDKGSIPLRRTKKFAKLYLAAPVVKWISHRSSEPLFWVRILAGALKILLKTKLNIKVVF